MQNFKIVSRWNSEKILFEGEFKTFSDCLKQAVIRKVNLRNADLQDADLWNANLQDANLWNANLRNANLRNADLRNADLQDADLQDADLRNADLQDANLQDANLWNCTGNMKEIKSGQFETYQFAYTFNRLQIGCKNYSIAEWKEFSDRDILEMDSKQALTFWKKWKNVIFQIIEMSPAVATGKETEQ